MEETGRNKNFEKDFGFVEIGIDFETDIRNCVNLAKVAYDYLEIDTYHGGTLHISWQEKEERVISLLDSLRRSLNEVAENYQQKKIWEGRTKETSEIVGVGQFKATDKEEG